MDSFTIDLPLPSKKLHANSPLDPRYKATDRAAAKRDAKVVAEAKLRSLGQPPPDWREVAIHVHFRWPDRNHKQDADNAGFCVKAYIDGLKRFSAPAKKIKATGMVIPPIEGAGILANDDEIVEWRVTWEIDKANPGVTITITPVAQEVAA